MKPKSIQRSLRTTSGGVIQILFRNVITIIPWAEATSWIVVPWHPVNNDGKAVTLPVITWNIRSSVSIRDYLILHRLTWMYERPLFISGPRSCCGVTWRLETPTCKVMSLASSTWPLLMLKPTCTSMECCVIPSGWLHDGMGTGLENCAVIGGLCKQHTTV